MTTPTQTLIIGAGQAGLALSRCLTDLQLDHLVLERGRVAERWRSERWDSFRLLSPNWQARLPGHRYRGPDPDGFMARDEIVAFFDGYAGSFGAPVRTGVTVSVVEPAERGGWTVRTDTGAFQAANVVVATGDLDRPVVPTLASGLPAGVHQLHSSRYRNPAQLAPAGVLVVGTGPSGQQIADELARSGRRVHCAVGRHRGLPRRYRGHDVYWWMDRMGTLHRTVDTLPGGAAPRSSNAVLAGGREDLDVRRLVAHGVVPHGRLVAVDDGRLHFADDLGVRLAEADQNADRFRAKVDAYVSRNRLDAPAEAVSRQPVPVGGPRALDLTRAGIGTVLWATGFRRDYGWLRAAVLDEDGEPVHRRGVTAAPGLFFLGLRWQHRRNSSFIDGVGADAAFLAEQIAARGTRRCAA